MAHTAAALAAVLLLLPCALGAGLLTLGTKEIVGYFASWEDWNPTQNALGGIPPYVTTVVMAFAKPDMTFSPGSFAGTGVQYLDNYYATVKANINTLKQKGTRVLLAIGGATYSNWNGINNGAIAAFVADMGFSGVDIDFEPAFDSVSCSSPNSVPACNTDALFGSVIVSLRAAVPRPLILSLAAYSIGAYGWGQYASAQPIGSHTGMSYNPLKAHGEALDLINLMSYDADNQYSPTLATQSYLDLLSGTGFNGKIVTGLEVPPECCGHTLTMDEANSVAAWQNANSGGGTMLWYLGPRKASSPSPTQVVQAWCNSYGFGGCSAPLYTCDGCVNVAPLEVSELTTSRTNFQDAVQSAPTDISTGFTYGNPNQMPPLASVPRAVVDNFEFGGNIGPIPYVPGLGYNLP